MMIPVGKLADEFARRDSHRGDILERAERAAEVTIPSLFPKSGHTEASKLPTPYQALGAKAVNHLSSKIVLALFPPNTAWFKVGLDDVSRAQLTDQQLDVNKITRDLSLLEQTVVSELEQTRLRSVIALVVKHLLVAGNALLDVMPDGNFRYLGLRSFVADRDAAGNIVDVVVKEKLSPRTIDEKILDACFDEHDRRELNASPEKTVELFTAMERDGTKYRIRQELNGKVVPDSEGTFPLDSPRYIVLRWTSVPNENYGRGMVEELYGDLKALDNISRDLLKMSALAAKVVFTVRPNSFLTPRKLEECSSGSVVKGDPDDVSTISVDKLNDSRIALERLRDLEASLASSFLMNSSVQRNAERVTAEEIRFMSEELESALGGVYSSLAQELQVPLLRRYLKYLAGKNLIPKLPNRGVNLSITTGLEALGRSHEVNKLIQFIQVAREAIGEQQLTMRLNSQSILNLIAGGLGLASDDIVRSEEQIQEEMQRQQAAQMAQSVAPGVAQEMAKQQAQGGTPNG